MKMTLKMGLALSSALLLMSGCATTELQTSAKMTQSIFVSPASKEKRTIFVSMRNTSGTDIALEPRVTQALINKGYTIVGDPDKATYVLMANVLYCDKKSENNVGNGAAMGGAAGAIGNSGSNLHSAVIAGVAGAVVGGLIGKATEDSIFQMQVDIAVREKAKGKVSATTSNVGGQATVRDSRKSGFANSFAGDIRNNDASGKLSSNSYSGSSQAYESDYIEHKTMMFAEATKMDLTLTEAIPVLEQKIATQIAGIF